MMAPMTALLGPTSATAQVRVSGPGPASGEAFATIRAAVAAAAAHDTVHVPSGVWTEGEPVVVDRPLTLRGEAGAVLDARGDHELLVVEADSVTVEGLTLRETGVSFTQDRAAIRVEKARFCTIRRNRLENTFFGIYLANAGDCRVEDNVLEGAQTSESQSGNGIHLWYSVRVVITGNEIRGHRDGIYFEFVEDSRVEANRSTNNLRYGLHFLSLIHI